MVEKGNLSIKQQQWADLARRVAKYNPRQPIDESVKKTVIALNLLGVKTNSCCGGHRDYRPLQGPYISFTENNWTPHNATQKETEAAKQAEPHEVAKRLQSYLDEFNAGKKVRRSTLEVNQDTHCGIIYNKGNKTRILPPDYDSSSYNGPDSKVGRIELVLYQRQIRKFGEFIDTPAPSL